ncbi:GlsB/YeaQ/YmgE family stress response membrane protein [Collimonas fungivorans]|nr:GlsB/YeaQ/YmgE family stress response membrane protein [Collimonas fungivorans]
MGILWTIIVGFVVGVIAKFLHPGKENMGFIVTTLLGIAGSFLAGYIGQALGWYQAGQGAGFIGSIVGALILLLIYGFVKGKAAS